MKLPKTLPELRQGEKLAGLDFRFRGLRNRHCIGYRFGAQADRSRPTSDLDLLPE
jgi:hypothetical protein